MALVVRSRIVFGVAVVRSRVRVVRAIVVGGFVALSVRVVVSLSVPISVPIFVSVIVTARNWKDDSKRACKTHAKRKQNAPEVSLGYIMRNVLQNARKERRARSYRREGFLKIFISQKKLTGFTRATLDAQLAAYH